MDDIISNTENRNRLYIPSIKNFPSWDFIFDNGKFTLFFQISISPFWEGHDDKIIKSFQNGKLIKKN